MKRVITCLIIIFSISVSFSQVQLDSKNSLNSFITNTTISVTIGGDFPVTGSFPAFINERVDQFITRMYTEARQKDLQYVTDPQLIVAIAKKLNRFSLRDITLKRSSGEVINLDLQKFRVDGNFKNNPYLRNDDVIIFPADDLDRNFFSISGAVNNPDKFYFVRGDKLSDAIVLAQGINKAYEDVRKAEIDRLSDNGEKMTSIIVNIDSNVTLQRGDRIKILATETQKKDFSVTVLGEVNQPGKIAITKDQTTIKEVIDKAGGFKKDASLENSRLYTANSFPYLLNAFYGVKVKGSSEILNLQNISNTDFLLRYENMLMLRMSNVNEEDSSYFILENNLRLLLESGPVNFKNIEDKNFKDAEYIVKDGDVIIVPENKNRVYVFGQVAHPGYVDIVPGMNYEYYIDKAGGEGDYARGDVMLIKGSSRNWISVKDDDAKIEDGDFIYVPRSLSRSFNFYVRLAANYLSIAASVATLILLLRTLR